MPRWWRVVCLFTGLPIYLHATSMFKGTMARGFHFSYNILFEPQCFSYVHGSLKVVLLAVSYMAMSVY